MKNLVFSLAFSLVGFVSFANLSSLTANNADVEKIEITKKTLNVQQLSFDVFAKMIQEGKLSGKIVTIDDKWVTFQFLDDCGNTWDVSYNDMYYTGFTAMVTASSMIYEATGC